MNPATNNNPLSPDDLAKSIQAANPNRRTRLVFILLMAAVALGLAAWYWSHKKDQAKAGVPRYYCENLQRGDINLVITATGNLNPTKEVMVGSELSGIALEVYVDINDHVTKGQVLAKLDTTKLNQQITSSKAALTSAKARVAQAEATVKETTAALQRLQELHRISGGKIPAKSDLDMAIATADRAKADLSSAQANVGEADAQISIIENDLAKALIKSPIDGIVLSRSIEPGQTVAASFTAPQLFLIAENLDHMKLKIAIAEADIARVKAGQTATFSVDAWPNRTYTALVKRVAYGSVVTENIVTYMTELSVDNDDLSLRPGMTATTDIKVAESHNVIVVPTSALRFNPVSRSVEIAQTPKTFMQKLFPMPSRRGQNRAPEIKDETKSSEPIIWVLKNGQPESITVKLGISDGNKTEISGDRLSEDMKVILRMNLTSE